MSEQIAAVFSDVDSTQIIPGQDVLSPVVQAAAQALHARGVTLHQVTARTHGLNRDLVEPLMLGSNLCAFDGGATIAPADSGEPVWRGWLEAEQVGSIMTAIGGLCTRIYYDLGHRKWQAPEVMAALDSGRLQLAPAPAIFAVFPVGLVDTVESSLEDVGLAARAMHYDKDSTQRCLQVRVPGVDKLSGAQELRRRAGLMGKRILLIGDGDNDIELFAAAQPGDVKVALQNDHLPEELRAAADWLAPPVHEDGFAAAMHELVL